ncbi:MAG: hypothetical protein A2275_15180 [Bacteroidetes bacterium RIFOXYA12_FULL_35_11]|nr:MAG: hypothetical protein A2X01_18085 [Bacteroidetes bacterium GWF2_35_48]OFY80208.1 MAG: hypothetical protein A2275_15180 [Bacteroidetes bacterium RIFOXYA12_FULL_35_11]OFY94508.1 MAG: hypothetical protein A2309_01405 [Bacteroidetes bacterium RIFOXYB2_FULL_35_7]OFY95011.1 MAG: hypothetical protein A2491_16875 [Bacteroidetes bacterium RIFOXYC12_FULL_35_7]HBX51711.1 hypothetical protein [Bacteroidales bacterium]
MDNQKSIYFFGHQEAENWLSQAGFIIDNFEDGFILNTSPSIVISTYFPWKQQESDAGLKCAVQLRAEGYRNPMLLLSFLPFNKVSETDQHGFFALPGSGFLRLPCSKQEISETLAKIPIPLPVDLLPFRIKVKKTEAIEKIRQMKHGNRFDFVNNISSPLISLCNAVISGFNLIPELKLQLQKISVYREQHDLQELFDMAGVEFGDDPFFNVLNKFTSGFGNLESISAIQNIDPKNIINILDELNNNLSYLLSYEQ